MSGDMKLVLVLVAVLWTECSVAQTDLGQCTNVADNQVCGDVTSDVNGCSASVGWGYMWYSWTCNNEDFKCYRHCVDSLEQDSACPTIQDSGCNHMSNGPCEPFQGDCGVGSRDITWDCGPDGIIHCPFLCCCEACAPTGAPIPQPLVCDDFHDDMLCECLTGGKLDGRVPGSCFVLVESRVNWTTARDNCVNDHGGWLVEVTTQGRNDVVQDLSAASTYGAWLGGYMDDSDPYLFNWVTHSVPPAAITGTHFTWYTDPQGNIERKCIDMYDGGLEPYLCWADQVYICEY